VCNCLCLHQHYLWGHQRLLDTLQISNIFQRDVSHLIALEHHCLDSVRRWNVSVARVRVGVRRHVEILVADVERHQPRSETLVFQWQLRRITCVPLYRGLRA
jgi:hypothetical protein